MDPSAELANQLAVPVATGVQAASLFGVAGVPLVLALVEVLKRAFDPPPRWTPLLSLAVGIGLNLSLGMGLLHLAPGDALLSGVVVGLAASGLYSGARGWLPPPTPTPM